MKQTPKKQTIENKVRPEIAKLIHKLTKKYHKVWQDLAKV